MQVKEAFKTSILLANLTEAQIDKLTSMIVERTFYKNEIIFRENDSAENIYILAEGKVCIERRHVPHRHLLPKQILTVKKGQVFGEMAFIEKRPRSATARAKSNCHLAALPITALAALMESDTQLGFILMSNIAHILSKRLRRMNDQWVRAVAKELNITEFEYY